MNQTKVDGCCGDLYGQDAARLILGEAWHPGGLELTGKLASKLGIGPQDRVLDIACGMGTTARFLATNFGCAVIGVDRSFRSYGGADRRSAGAGTEFAVGEANNIPLADSSVDAAVMECVLSSFEDKRRALGEVIRVLKPGGELGVSDIVTDGEIPKALRAPFLQAFCVSGALPTRSYLELFRASGFKGVVHEEESLQAVEFVENLRKKVFVAQLLEGVGKLSLGVSGDMLKEAGHLLSMAKRSIREGALGYSLFVARKPG